MPAHKTTTMEEAMHHATRLSAGLILTFTVAGAYAQKPDTYPSRPVRFVAPFVAGGPSDILSRMMAAKLADALGQQFVVDNRGSAGGIVGFEIGAKAPPDGYTIMLAANSGLTINQHVYKKLPYDPERDYIPITQLTNGGNVMVVHPSVAAKSVQEFIALGKAQPGKLNYATTGTGNLLGAANFAKMAGITMTPIAYKGTGQALVELVGGHVQMFMMNPLVAIPHVKSGKLRGLGITSLERNIALPDMPTVHESGLPNFKYLTWHSILAPAGTPRPIVNKLNAELVKALNMPDVKQKIQGEGLAVIGNKPEDVIALIKAESKETAELVKAINFQKL
jgi:tripartite-type tricarboxylate transporter receptor subunit TctC